VKLTGKIPGLPMTISRCAGSWKGASLAAAAVCGPGGFNFGSALKRSFTDRLGGGGGETRPVTTVERFPPCGGSARPATRPIP